MTNKPEFSCQELLYGNVEDFLKWYNGCFEQIRKWVLAHSGTSDDAYDLFHESVLILFQNCRKGDLKLTSPPCAYIRGVVRNKWNTELKKRKKKVDPQKEDFDYYDNNEMKLQRIVAKYFMRLKTKCRKILRLSVIESKPDKDAAAIMEMKDGYFRLAKYRCLKNLGKMIKDDDQWNDLK